MNQHLFTLFATFSVISLWGCSRQEDQDASLLFVQVAKSGSPVRGQMLVYSGMEMLTS